MTQMSHFGVYTERKKKKNRIMRINDICPPRVYCSTIYNSQDIETACISSPQSFWPQGPVS